MPRQPGPRLAQCVLTPLRIILLAEAILIMLIQCTIKYLIPNITDCLITRYRNSTVGWLPTLPTVVLQEHALVSEYVTAYRIKYSRLSDYAKGVKKTS